MSERHEQWVGLEYVEAHGMPGMPAPKDPVRSLAAMKAHARRRENARIARLSQARAANRKASKLSRADVRIAKVSRAHSPVSP